MIRDKNIDTVDVLETVRHIEGVKGKYLKLALSNLERLGPLDPKVRKVVLDAFNDLTRALLKSLYNFTLDD